MSDPVVFEKTLEGWKKDLVIVEAQISGLDNTLETLKKERRHLENTRIYIAGKIKIYEK